MECVMKNVKTNIVEEAENLLEKLAAEASNDSVRTKLRNLNDVCRAIVTETKYRLTVPAVLRQYKVRFPDVSQSLSEQTVRNKRANGNPYQMLYRMWEGLAERILATSSPMHVRMDGGIICESEIRKIENTTLRHQVLLLFGQNRSLHNQLNILKQDACNAPIHIDGLPSIAGGEDLALSPAEVEAVRDFIDPRKLRAKQLAKTKDDGVSTRDGRSVADPGFITALEKISKSYQRP
jgi:hypothetical protein